MKLLLLRLGPVLRDGGADPGQAHEAAAERLAPLALAISSLRITCSMIRAAATAAILGRPGEADPALLADLALPRAAPRLGSAVRFRREVLQR